MRTIVLVIAVLLLAVFGYATYRDPAGGHKLMADVGSTANSGFQKMRLDARPIVASLWPNSPPAAETRPILSVIDKHLVSADGSPFTFSAQAPASSIRYYALYYSAQWSAPCQVFTPVLVHWYNRFKPAHPDFEVIFVSEDHSKTAWLAEMKDAAMPWPAFSFDDLQQNGKDIGKFFGYEMPDLVLVDAKGTLISDSFTANGTYLGPQQVLEDIEKLLGSGATAAPAESAQASSLLAPGSASTTPNAVTPSNPAPLPLQSWSAPDVMPAEPNWTWTTSDGTSYQNVVVTQIGPETVSITHSTGVVHDIPIANLPPDIQKKLNYDPVAAAAERQETAREEAHPFYLLATRADAQQLARQMHWPLAWMDSNAADLAVQNPIPNSEEDLTQRALNRLKTRSIVIFAEGNVDLGSLPPLVLNQIFTLDDGPMPGGHHFYAPKIVLTDPDVTKVLGRISHAQLITSGDAAIDNAFAAMPVPAPQENTTAPSSSGPSADTPKP